MISDQQITWKCILVARLLGGGSAGTICLLQAKGPKIKNNASSSHCFNFATQQNQQVSGNTLQVVNKRDINQRGH